MRVVLVLCATCRRGSALSRVEAFADKTATLFTHTKTAISEEFLLDNQAHAPLYDRGPGDRVRVVRGLWLSGVWLPGCG